MAGRNIRPGSHDSDDFVADGSLVPPRGEVLVPLNEFEVVRSIRELIRPNPVRLIRQIT
jgi:hypothetical protein